MMIVVAVVVIDLLILVVSTPPLDENMGQISKALTARDQNPTPETQRALIAALEEPHQKKWLRRVWLSVGILVVTGTGLFIAGCAFERRQWQASMSMAR